MGNGYLGKISAIVSANTADFDSKLSKSAAEVRKFAGSMQGSLTSAQSGSASALNGIYTSAQKLERALQAVASQKLSFKGFQGPDLQSAVTRMQGLYSAAEQVNKPLSNAVKTFGRLAISVQGEFNPALQSAQTAAEKLADTIDRTGTASVDQFSRVARQVEFTTAAMKRLDEAGKMVSGLATGQELRFQRPEMVAEMQRSASLQSQAAQMSPGAMASNGIAGLVSQQRAAAVETERLAAALENERLLVNGNVEAATAAYQSQLAVQRGLNDEIERRVGAGAAAAARTVSAAESEIAVLQRRQQASKAAEVERQAQSQRVADSELANLQRVQQASKAAEVDRQAQSQRVADSELANLQRVQQASKAAEVERQAQAQRRSEGEIATLIRREQAAKAEALGGDGSINLGMDIEDPRRQLGVLEGSITSLKSKIDTLPEPLRARFVPAIRDAEREFARLSTAVVPVAGEIEAARRRLVVLTQDANRAAAAMNFAGSFGGEGVTGINLGLDQRALRGYEASLMSLQNALGRTQAAARGPAVAAFNALRNAIAEAMAAGTLEEPLTQQRIARLQAAAVNATSRAGGGSVNRIRRDMQRAGDIGRGSSENRSTFARHNCSCCRMKESFSRAGVCLSSFKKTEVGAVCVWSGTGATGPPKLFNKLTARRAPKTDLRVCQSASTTATCVVCAPSSCSSAFKPRSKGKALNPLLSEACNAAALTMPPSCQTPQSIHSAGRLCLRRMCAKPAKKPFALV